MSGYKPLVSIVVAVYNGAKTLQRCIDSVVKQTYQNKEFIIVDGDSSDGTVEILKKNSDNIFYWESKPDSGIYHAWNKALEHARGDWICFIGADDYFYRDDVLMNMLPSLELAVSSKVRIVYGNIARYYPDGNICSVWERPWEENKNKLSDYLPIPHVGMFHHKELFLEKGKFDEEFQIAGDYELLLRELRFSTPLYVKDVIVVAHELGGISNDQKLIFKRLKENYLARKKNGISPLTPHYCIRWIIATLRFCISRLFGDKITNIAVDICKMCIGKGRT